MSELIRREDVQKEIQKSFDDGAFRWQDGKDLMDRINAIPSVDSVPIKFICEVIKYLTKCRNYAQHEETRDTWDEQRQALIMLLHEWDAYNVCGRTGEYGEWNEK